MFICDFCHKQFIKKQGLDYHVTHKVCLKLGKTCIKCGYQFTTKAMFQYHMDNNVCDKPIQKKKKLTLKKTNDTPIFTKSGEPHFPNDCTKEELLMKVAILEAEKKMLLENPRTVDDHSNHQINFIFPKAFGSEQIDYILTKIPNLLHDAVTKHTGRSVEYLTEQIHCNKEIFPEYTNVFIRGYKSPFALVSNGDKFQNKPQKRIIEQIIENSISMLQDYIDNNGEKYGQRIIDKYETYRDLVEDGDKKSERRKDLEIEIAGMLLDMRPIIESEPYMKHLLDKLEGGEFTQTMKTK